jgi:hypothetical protein
VDAPQKYRIVRRFALNTGNQVFPAAASQNAVQVVGPQLTLPAITPDQALRIISGVGTIADSAQTHFLTMLGSNLMLGCANASGNPIGPVVRSWQPYSAPLLLGAQGSRVAFIDDEFLYGTDYQEFVAPGAQAAGRFGLSYSADITNSDAAVHNITFSILCLVELYQLKPSVGQ